MVDTQVIAMGVKLARQKNEQHLIKKEPQPLTEFRPANFDADYQKKFDELASDDESDGDSSEEAEAGPKKRRPARADDDDEFTTVGEDRQTRRTKQRKEEK